MNIFKKFMNAVKAGFAEYNGTIKSNFKRKRCRRSHYTNVKTGEVRFLAWPPKGDDWVKSTFKTVVRKTEKNKFFKPEPVVEIEEVPEEQFFKAKPEPKLLTVEYLDKIKQKSEPKPEIIDDRSRPDLYRWWVKDARETLSKECPGEGWVPKTGKIKTLTPTNKNHNLGRHHYNDGTTEVLACTCPPGFKPGRLASFSKKMKGRKYNIQKTQDANH